jgi:hypothetical protein
LADINLYGAISQPGEVRLLANQSFTITADVADLLAVKDAVQASLAEGQHDTTISTSTTEPTPSIDLELFNLVKTPPSIPAPLSYPSINLPLPESIDLQALKKQTDLRVPQLPKLPETPIEAPATNDLVAEPSLDIPLLETEETTVSLPPAPIDLDKLVIKSKRLRGSSLPFLKRLPTEPSVNEEPTSEVTEELFLAVTEELPQADVAITEPETQLDEALTDTPVEDEPVAEIEAEATPEVITASETAEIIDPSAPEEPTSLTELDENVTQVISIAPPRPHYSPLIRKWMESQGYTLPEIFPDTNEVPQEQITSEELPPTPPTAETPEFEDNLPQR